MTESTMVKTILDAISADNKILSLIDTYDSVPMIVFNPIVPELWGLKSKTINMYIASSTNQESYTSMLFGISCRAQSPKDSRAIALAIRDCLNRLNKQGYFVEVTVRNSMRPSNPETDNWNTPCDVYFRSR